MSTSTSTLPTTQVFTGNGEPLEECVLIEFRLLYVGDLPPSSNHNRRPKEKHEIRRQFHPQLRRLWTTQSNLTQLASNKYIESFPKSQLGVVGRKPLDERFREGLGIIGKKWSRAGYDFVPLVTEDLALRCSIEILLLRPGDKPLLFEQGDIDGQLKTLFDALRIPANLGETGGIGPQEDESPFFCLLEDDRLISEVKVTSDELLLLPGQRETQPNDSFAVINVKLNHKNPRTFDNYFG